MHAKVVQVRSLHVPLVHSEHLDGIIIIPSGATRDEDMSKRTPNSSGANPNVTGYASTMKRGVRRYMQHVYRRHIKQCAATMATHVWRRQFCQTKPHEQRRLVVFVLHVTSGERPVGLSPRTLVMSADSKHSSMAG